jgi:soluble lytic murein transglycosylase
MLCRCAALALSMALLPAALRAAPAAAQAPAADVMALVRADRWPEAAAAAARYTDPVAAKLVTYYRLLAPGAAGTAEISAFQAASPDWPAQAVLARRRDEALAAEPDQAVLRAECAGAMPAAVASLLRCADAATAAHDIAGAVAMQRAAWIAGIADSAWEQRFLEEHGAALTAQDQAARFEHLMPGNLAAAERQAARLDPDLRAMALLRIALRRDDRDLPRLLAAVPESARASPFLFLDYATWLRRGGQDGAARELWLAAGAAAERAAGRDRERAFWNERNIIARRLLRQGDAAGAYRVAAGFAGTAGEPALDAAFLAGFIALRPLANPAMAEPHFRRLDALSPAAITQGRAHYWLGRTAAQRGDGAGAQAEFDRAAAWPSTFYGQLAALRGGGTTATLAARIARTGDPPADIARAQDFAGRELARAAAYLVGWGEARRAQAFLLRLEEVAPDAADRALGAKLAIGFGLPETAVALARRAGSDGIILLASGWPMPVSPPAVPEPALSLAVMRQESSFDSATVSPVGARGLMQLMPATAAQVARRLGIHPSVPALTGDPGYNMRLGTAYLADLLDSFDGSVPMAVAAYNAGPNRVADWVAMNGDPRSPSVDVIDWIELIPFGETRNYVQRVIENEVIYRALRGEQLPHPLAQWLR